LNIEQLKRKCKLAGLDPTILAEGVEQPRSGYQGVRKCEIGNSPVFLSAVSGSD
jgi:hypothetical protein